jgi:hypothetical protein
MIVQRAFTAYPPVAHWLSIPAYQLDLLAAKTVVELFRQAAGIERTRGRENERTEQAASWKTNNACNMGS